MIESIELEDTQLNKIASYFADNLNKLGNEVLNISLVRTIRLYDDLNVPKQDYPCLKLFRTADTFNGDSNLTYSDITLKYTVATSDYPKLAVYCYFLSRFINSCLLDIERILNIQLVRSQKQIIYGSVSYNQPNPIIDLITMNFRLTEGAIPNKIIDQLRKGLSN